MKIFQAYYRPDQVAHLDKEFTPFDNTANPVVNLHEYYIYTRLYQEATLLDEDLWGHFSWQWKRKLSGVPAGMIIDHINTNPGYDVYTFHPFPLETVAYWNVWEQGQWCHPHLVELGERILEDMQVDPNCMYVPMGTRDYLCVNYFVGNRDFWEGLMSWLHQFVDVCGRLPEKYLDLLNQSAGYGDNLSLDYRGFLCERMISSFFVQTRHQFRVKPFDPLYNAMLNPQQKEILSLKDRALDTKNKSSLEQYLNRRAVPQEHVNWGKEWINKCVL